MFDIAMFGRWIAAAGLVLLLAGGVYWLMNQPVKPRAATGLAAFGQMMAASDENLYREEHRGNATYVMIGGAIVGFLGVAIIVATRKQAS